MGISPILWVFAMLSNPSPSAAASSAKSLQPFNTVQLLSVPFNVRISPAEGYSFSISADAQVVDAVDVSVSNSVLSVRTHGNFRSQQPISATVFLPAGSLQQVLVQSSSNIIVVDTGFSVPTFSANVAGTSILYVRNLVAQRVSVTSTGTSSTFLSGSLGAVSLEGSGVSKFYLQGRANLLALNLKGVSSAESAICSDDLQITGHVAFPSRVLYQHGTCSLSEGGGKRRSLSQSSIHSAILGSPCEQVPSINIPTPDLRFTCGIDVKESTHASNGNSGRDGTAGNNGRDGSSASGGEGSNSIVVGGAGGAGGDNNGNSASDGSSGGGIGGITIQPLACQCHATRNMI